MLFIPGLSFRRQEAEQQFLDIQHQHQLPVARAATLLSFFCKARRPARLPTSVQAGKSRDKTHRRRFPFHSGITETGKARSSNDEAAVLQLVRPRVEIVREQVPSRALDFTFRLLVVVAAGRFARVSARRQIAQHQQRLRVSRRDRKVAADV